MKGLLSRGWVGVLASSIAVVLAQAIGETASATETLDVAGATVVTRAGDLPKAEQTAARMFVEELEKRVGKRLTIATTWPKEGLVVAITSGVADPAWGHAIPRREGRALPEKQPEGYRVFAEGGKIIWVVGADPRGALFGVGRLLRTLDWRPGAAHVPAALDVASAPVYRIRGHQLGYRARANSYDGWGEEHYDQYIRELVIFGSNSIENIPFQDTDQSPHMPLTREVMNRTMSEICDRYDVDYWVWTPAVFDLNDEKLRTEALAQHEALYRDCPRLDGVFFPGGDPGKNPPELVMPFLEDLARLLAKYHPDGEIWVSPQGFNAGQMATFIQYLEDTKPAWLAGIVAGPQTERITSLRARVPKQYPIRDYPDITHSVRCQYPALWWDAAFNFTLGRECCNPRPLFHSTVHRLTAPNTDGFISYSDGVHDDVNKVIWNLLSWDPQADTRGILIEYARFFFGPDVAEPVADGILALEKNWEGPLVNNGAVDGTLALWQRLEAENTRLKDDWRWQLCLLRAYYDAYTRHRQIYETALEEEANEVLAQARTRGPDAAMDAALATLNRAETEPCRKDLRKRIDQLCQALFDSICLQTSVERFQASEPERGCVLDFVDYPLNNRWWLEDEFAKIRAMPTDEEKLARLDLLAHWEHPGPGSFYDDVGNVAKSLHVVRGQELNTDPGVPAGRVISMPGFAWRDNGYCRDRLSRQSGMMSPDMIYENIDPDGQYVLRIAGRGELLPQINGQDVEPTVNQQQPEEFRELRVPSELLKDGRISLTWGGPDEGGGSRRRRAQVAEIWLIKE